MVRIFPFPALRPSQSHAFQVASQITGTETDEETRLYMQQNALSYLHIAKPYIHFGENKGFSEKHYQFARSYFGQLVEQGVLIPEDAPAIYIYRQSLPDGHKFTGIIAGVSAIDYLEGTIKKHEYTLTAKESQMVEHVAHTGVVGEPVLLSCPDEEFLTNWTGKHTNKAPDLEFQDHEARVHSIWAIKDADAIDEITKSMSSVDSLYIADGHHRIAATTDYLTRMHNEYNWSSKKMYFMSYILPESSLWIKPFHRLVKGLEGGEVESMVAKAGEKFLVEKAQSPIVPKQKGEIGLCTRKGWYKLIPKEAEKDASPAEGLDVSILEKYIFGDILNITDSKSDPRLQFIRGDMPARDLETLVQAGSIDAAFLLFPNTMAEIKAVADAEETMPPKSTWIEPKLLTGMMIQRFFE